MIKIHLLPQRKQKRAAEPGRAELGIGVGALIAAGAVVFLAVHQPALADRDKVRGQVQDLQDANQRARNQTKDMPALKAAVEAEERRAAAIDQLLGTVVVPDKLQRWTIEDKRLLLFVGGESAHIGSATFASSIAIVNGADLRDDFAI